MTMSRLKPSNVLLILTVGCALLALGCGVAAAAVRQGAIAPPAVNVQLGDMRLVGVTSQSPDCTRLIVPGCTPLNQVPTTHIYTLWLFVRSDPNSWDRPEITPLLSFQIGS
jgi:hypothetical protein